MPTVNGPNPRNIVAPRLGRRLVCIKDHDRGARYLAGSSWAITETDFIDQLYPQITIDLLPDNVLIEVFDSYLGQVGHIDAWHTLVHVCQRWRCLVFASPCRLNLQILCTPKRPVTVTPNVWPALPIVIDFSFGYYRLQETVTVNSNIAAALQQHNRVCKVDIRYVPSSFSETFEAMDKPFPALTELNISSLDRGVRVIPESFLAGFTPCLRKLCLARVQFPTLGKLLSSTNALVYLDLWGISHSGYISPEVMVTTLSMLTKLKRLTLDFELPLYHGDQASQLQSTDTRVVLPALTNLHYSGAEKYLEYIVSRIDAPRLKRVKILFFFREEHILNVPLLRDFIGRTEMLRAPHRAEIVFPTVGVDITLFREQGMLNDDILKLTLFDSRLSSCRLSALGQVCNSIIRPLHTLERLDISECDMASWHLEPDIENRKWLELLRAFTHVKDLVLSKRVVQHTAYALEELAGGRVTEVLPALQNIFLEGPRPSGSVTEAIGRFVDARQLSGFPVNIEYSK